MEEIKVGDYARTKPEGFLGRIINIKDEYDGTWYYMDNGYAKRRESIKCSFNIIDLIEKGDFVNGYEVDEYDGYDEEGNYFENDLGIPIYDDANMDCVVEYRPIRLMKIKSIVTKEQFKAMEYVIKEG